MKQKLRDIRLRGRAELFNGSCLWEGNVNFAKNVNFLLRSVQYFITLGENANCGRALGLELH